MESRIRPHILPAVTSDCAGEARRANGGFTLIEMLVVMALVALLLTLALPRYFHSVDRTKETVLKQNLVQMRDAIDKFYGDRGRYPDALQDLVAQKYLRNIPSDPVADSPSWFVVAPVDGDKGNVYDVKSTAPGNAMDGSKFSEW